MLLSIITINRNNSLGLRQTIESVLRQTFADYEYIVIDGASTDASVEVIRELSQQKTFRWLSEPDKGIYNAMNKGILMAQGEYLLFLNSGDRLAADDVLQQVFSEPQKADLLVGYQYEERDGVLRQMPQIEMPYISFDSFRNTNFPHQSTFIRRELLLRAGGYREDFHIVSDWAFNMLALFKLNATVQQLRQVVAIYDMTGMSSVADKEPQWAERRQFLTEEFPLFMRDYDRWDRLNRNGYMKLVNFVRNIKNRLK